MEKELEEMSYRELVDEAKEFGLDTSGKKSEVLERVKKFQLTGQVDETDDNHVEVIEVVENSVETEQVEVVEEPKKPEELVLVKMERSNRLFEAVGKTFTTKHPFNLVTKDQESHLVNVVGGFRPATRSEIDSYYE